MSAPANNLAQPVDVLRVMRSDALAAEEYRFTAAGDSIAKASRKDSDAARAAVAELVEADREHDAARDALIELNRRIAEHGWIDVEHDALRVAGQRFVAAQVRRAAALAALGGAK